MSGAIKAIKRCRPVHSNQSQHVDATLQIPPKTHLQRKAKRLHGKIAVSYSQMLGWQNSRGSSAQNGTSGRIYFKHLKGPWPCLLSSLLANHLNIASSDLQLGTSMPITIVLHVRPVPRLKPHRHRKSGSQAATRKNNFGSATAGSVRP